MAKTIMFIFACMIPISAMAFSAFLIYMQAQGWEWFLAATVLLICRFRIST